MSWLRASHTSTRDRHGSATAGVCCEDVIKKVDGPKEAVPELPVDQVNSPTRPRRPRARRARTRPSASEKDLKNDRTESPSTPPSPRPKVKAPKEGWWEVANTKPNDGKAAKDPHEQKKAPAHGGGHGGGGGFGGALANLAVTNVDADVGAWMNNTAPHAKEPMERKSHIDQLRRRWPAASRPRSRRSTTVAAW